MTSPLPAIRLEGISKSFGPVWANRDIHLDIHPGKILALLGENGAGKSTLMSILAGRFQPDAGHILLKGNPVVFSNTSQAIQAGIGMVYQHFMLVDAMTVAENVFLGQEQRFWLHRERMHQAVAQLAKANGLEIDPQARVADLSMGEKQRVEILRLLLRQSQVLIFDEPTAVLTPTEAEQLFRALRKMADQQKAIVFISHKLEEVLSLADDIAILRKGEVVDRMPIDQVTSAQDLACRMIGSESLPEVRRDPMEPRQVVLRVEQLSGRGMKNISITVRQGEILGIVGVAGNGQKPLVETICGLTAPESGTIRILGKPWVQFFKNYQWDGTLCYIPEDRRGLATCLDMDLVDNFLLTTRKGFTIGPWLKRNQAEKKTMELIDTFHVRPPNPKATAGRLSGGNLQKMVLAREFYRRPRLIVAEQPTQGLDIGAAEEIRNVLLKARERAGILLITGDLAEALAISDRIAVMFGGRIMDTFSIEDQDKVDRIQSLMAGLES